MNVRDEIFRFEIENFINWCGELIGMGSREDHKDVEALHPQFWSARTANAFGGLKLPFSPCTAISDLRRADKNTSSWDTHTFYQSSQAMPTLRKLFNM